MRHVLQELHSAALVSRLKLPAALLALLGIAAVPPAYGVAAEEKVQKQPAGGPAVPGQAVGRRSEADTDRLPPGAVRRLGTVRFRHGVGNTDVAFAPGGKLLLSVTLGTVRFWHVATGKEVATPAALPRGNTACAALSPDGATLALGEDDGTVRLCERTTGREVRTLRGPAGVVLTLAFAPDGRHVMAAGNFDTQLSLWDTSTGALRRRFPTTREKCLAFSPGGKLLATCPDSGVVQLWDLTADRQRGTFRDSQGILSIGFAPDGKTLAAGTERGEVVLWEVATGKQKTRLAHFVPKVKVVPNPFMRLPGRQPAPVYRAPVRAVAFAPDGRTLAAAGDIIRLWDVASGKERPWPEGGVVRAARPVFSPDGKLLASGDGGAVRLWDVVSGRRLRQPVGHESQVFDVGFSPDGRVVVSKSWGVDSSLRLWETATGRELARVHFPEGGAAFLSPQGRLVASDDRSGATRVVDVVTGHEVRRFPGWMHVAFASAFSPDGKLLAAGTMQGEIGLWDWATGTLVRRLTGHREHLHALAFTRDGKLLASAGDDKTLRLWDAEAGKELRRADLDVLPWALGVAADGKTLATGNNDGSIRILDTATLREVRRIRDTHHGTIALAYSPDGKVVASAGNGGVYLWDATTGKELRALRGHRGTVRAVAFSPDGSLLASAADDTTILLWRVKGGADGQATAPIQPGEKELAAWWRDLAGEDGFRACLAVRRLADAPDRAVPWLAARLRPLAAAEPAVVRLVRDLGAPRYAVRARAARELTRLGDRAGPGLRQALAGRPTLEVRRRLEKLLVRLEETAYPPERLQAVRAVVALERAGTPAARALLRELVRGAGDARLTRAAGEALARLDRP
jgi:WD40 repeat protein